MCTNYTKKGHKHGDSITTFDQLLNDWPIESSSEDLFDLTEEAEKIAKYIISTEKERTRSFAITAQWGAGKTSFLNLIIEHLRKFQSPELEFIKFNPRDCKSYHSIQEEFFTQLACLLSKYDSRCTNLVKDYMASLKLIDNRGIFEKLTNFYSIWNKIDLKESIKKTFVSLDKKVIVLIDDFDRLSKEEIMEVLKLIDGNAAFGNMVFLTAYDKKQVNKALGETNQTQDACFVDKFFNFELSIPSRPYSYILHYIISTLTTIIGAEENEAAQISEAVCNRSGIFRTNIPTMRDAKRYINQILFDYKRVRGDVNVEEFLLVGLMKYRFPEEYKLLYKKTYLGYGSSLFNDSQYYLKDNLSVDERVKVLLSCLFPSKESRLDNPYRHIYETQSFENYFINRLATSLRIRDMKRVLFEDKNVAIKLINQWLTKDDTTKDIVDYLNSLNYEDFNNQELFIRFVEIIERIAIKNTETRAYWVFLRLIRITNITRYNLRYKIDLNALRNDLLTILLDKDMDEECRTLRSIHKNFVTGELHSQEMLITDEDIWPYVKSQFIAYLQGNADEQKKRNWLYDCTSSIDKTSDKIDLDPDCTSAYKSYVFEHPEWYIQNFVRLGCISSSQEINTICGEVFWRQIFGSTAEFERFLKKCESKGVAGVTLVRNFWSLYLANGETPIEFRHQGNVQEKINRGLNDECKLLSKLREIESCVAAIPEKKEGLSKEEKEKYRIQLETNEKELDRVSLYISLNGNIRNEIERRKRILS